MDARPPSRLPDLAEAELALSLERAYRETRVVDRLVAIWALLLAKCCLLQAAILRWDIPVSGLVYVWCLSLSLGLLASFHYLRAHRAELALVPANRRAGAALLAGLLVVLAGAAQATFGLGLLSPPALAALACGLGGVQALTQAALRRRTEPALGAVAWWAVAWLALRQGGAGALACVGLGCLFGSALPGFALVGAAHDRRG